MTADQISRRAIGAAAAAGVAAAILPQSAARAEAPGQLYHVFFEQDEMIAPPGTLRLVGALKGRIKRNATVTLTGHCDASERDPDKLTLARAMEIHGMLVGVGAPPETKFQIVAKGATSPSPGTDPAQPNPRNRRVAVTIA